MDEGTDEFAYGPRTTDIVLLPAIFAAAAAISALIGSSGMRVVTYSLAAIGVFAALIGAYRSSLGQRIVLGARGLIVPASSWSRRTVEIPYQEIAGYSQWNFGRARSVHIFHSHGMRPLTSMLFPSDRAFDAFLARLEERVRRANDPPPPSPPPATRPSP